MARLLWVHGIDVVSFLDAECGEQTRFFVCWVCIAPIGDITH